MPLRSMLFVPGDSESKLAGATRHGADALILDLEDSVAPSRKQAARQMCAQYLRAPRAGVLPKLYVRLNAIQTGLTWDDVDAVLPAAPAGLILPKGEPRLLHELDTRLLALEARSGVEMGSTRIIVIATETPRAMFSLGEYPDVSKRLQALAWGGEDLAAELGGVNRSADGHYDDPYRLARSLCVLGAGAAGVDAIDAAFMNYHDDLAFRRECQDGRRLGYTGKFAIHPAQVAIINEAFAPSEAEVTWARKVVAAFRAEPNLGVVGIDGKVVDRPHLRLAERLLARV